MARLQIERKNLREGKLFQSLVIRECFFFNEFGGNIYMRIETVARQGEVIVNAIDLSTGVAKRFENNDLVYPIPTSKLTLEEE